METLSVAVASRGVDFFVLSGRGGGATYQKFQVGKQKKKGENSAPGHAAKAFIKTYISLHLSWHRTLASTLRQYGFLDFIFSKT